MKSITAYRIVKAKHLDQAFSGEGARLWGGRWNSPGKYCVYLSCAPALAQLEILAHTAPSSILDSYRLLSIELPTQSMDRIELADLPNGWSKSPAPVELADLGDKWLSSDSAGLALALPSVMSPYPIEMNYLVNTAHAAWSDCLRTTQEISFRMNARLRPANP